MPNVTISKFSDFSGKKFLVVDDFPEFRTAIKRMVEAFGATDIETSSNGEDAISKIAINKYDAILCDYNLGEGRDGQQVLEEGKFRGLIGEKQIFIMLTAENTAEMVMGALEYEPDGYLVKPFNKEMVHTRLTKVEAKKRELMPIFQEMDKKNLDKALLLCDEYVSTGNSQALNCLKIKGKLLMKMKRYKEAEEHYKKVIEQKKLPWALMGLGQVYYNQGLYDESEQQFRDILELSKVNVEAHDWIARCQVAKTRIVDAQTTLEHAIKLSPKAILRQQFLGDLAYQNKDFETAEKAYKAAVFLGKHSCYRKADDYMRYAELLIKRGKADDNDRNKVRAISDAISALDSLVALYNDDLKTQAKAFILQISAMNILSRSDNKAGVIAKRAIKIMDKEHIVLEPQLMAMLGETLVKAGEAERGQKLIDEFGAKEVAPEGGADAAPETSKEQKK